MPTAENGIRDNIYSASGLPIGIDIVLSDSEIAVPSEKFCSIPAVGIGKQLKGALSAKLSPLVLAKRLGFSLCQVFELIEAGSIICRNGLIPAEEAERLLHPKIEKV